MRYRVGFGRYEKNFIGSRSRRGFIVAEGTLNGLGWYDWACRDRKKIPYMHDRVVGKYIISLRIDFKENYNS